MYPLYLKAGLAAICLAFIAINATADEAVKLADRYAEVNGVKLHYVEAGKGPVILFLHGFPEFWYAWKDQLK